MKHLRIFEEWNKERFASKEDQKNFYRNLNPIAPVEERTLTPDQLSEFDIPDEIIEQMKSWDVIVKSPYSASFYNSKEISWNHKPDGSFRVSDHWNFIIGDKKHCRTDKHVKNTTHMSLGLYDRKAGQYKILLSLPTPDYIKKQDLAVKKKEFMKNPELIAKKKDLKTRVDNKEITAQVCDQKNPDLILSKGILRRYTGHEIKIENSKGEVIYNDDDLDNKIINLFDNDGEPVSNPFDIKFESLKYICRYEIFENI